MSEASPREIIVRQGRRVRRIAYRPGDTVLDTLRRAEISSDSQCEQGYCGSCVFQLLRGEVRLRFNTALDDAALAEGLRLACQGLPLGDVVEIELL